MPFSSAAINRCNLPPWVIASPAFNSHPQRLEIQGVRAAHRLLFDQLACLETREKRGLQFHDYMDVSFQLHQWEQQATERGRKSLKNSYLRFLRGWMFDANSIEGAVLKGWVESRIGLPPTYHKGPIEDIHGEAYFRYLTERMKGSARTSALLLQLDLLYEFGQYELEREKGGLGHCTLFRGVQDFSEQRILKPLGKNRHLIRLNNLTSFTTDFERAWEFGTRVMQVEVPTPKIFFRCDLLPRALLKGEEEVLVIGGDFEIKILTGG
ncbi:NAD(+)--dinitrogen-reductase ADP-D-ribosyltransferase [Desulfuromonas sp. KJ2020]|uniref:NAD(+)--dinitrogen-reductase ADP-D-ribosyltransferase n=1 Tax=Desulfuromonas sp. KJ2020 TaxID=2919173 RepID=UPI0020A76A07|nr:NAD(+)--dinitrogen-reductase ADP-D-ribosyltransferase [Desulfuromonas sp. KJ2020]